MTLLIDGELVLYGFVGDNYWDMGFTAREVLDALAEHGRDNDLVVRINSGGGYTDDGVAIFNALMMHKGKVTTVVDAMAASAASIIAMAGDERLMRTGALMMAHDPASLTWGTADDHRRSIALLDRLGEQMAGIYCDRTGDDPAAMRTEMKAELWLTPDEAVERGFATGKDSTSSASVSAFDYTVYAKAPEPLRAMATANSWSLSRARPKAAASATVPPGPSGDANMSEKPTADALATASASARTEGATAARERIKAIMTSAEAKGRSDLAEHFAYDTEMNVEAAIAALAKAPSTPDTAADSAQPAASAANPAGYDANRAAAAALATPAGKPTAKSGLSSRIDAHIAKTNRA